MYKHLFRSKPKSSLHGLWYILGAAGLGYLLGRNKPFKGFCREGHHSHKETPKGPKQGWYGISDKEMDNEFREDIMYDKEEKDIGKNDKVVEVERKMKNGFPTETILKKD